MKIIDIRKIRIILDDIILLINNKISKYCYYHHNNYLINKIYI